MTVDELVSKYEPAMPCASGDVWSAIHALAKEIDILKGPTYAEEEKDQD